MAVYEKRGSAGAIRHTETHLGACPAISGSSSRLGILKELTKNPVNITVANAPAGAKVITFTRGEKFFETRLRKLKFLLPLNGQNLLSYQGLKPAWFGQHH